MKMLIARFKNVSKNQGFTFVELAIAMGISAILLTIATISLSKVQRSASVNGTVQTMLSDIASQQLKAMVGATEGRASSDSYGLYFQNSQYTMFHGTVYNSADSTNIVVKVDPPITLSSTLPNGLLIFSRSSGDAMSWVLGQNTIVVTNTAGTEKKTMSINRYGVITSIQ